MLDFELDKRARCCAATGRELRPGDHYVSVIVQEGALMKRLDYALEAWTGPPEHVLAWWRSQVPDGTSARPTWAPNEVMLSLLEEKLTVVGDEDFCYVLGLLLIRRKILRQESTEPVAGGEVMVLFEPTTSAEYRVPVREPSAARIQAIQQFLADLLIAPNAPSIPSADVSEPPRGEES